MEGGDLRKALSAPDHSRYAWNNLGQLVALDMVRGLHFLHTNKVCILTLARDFILAQRSMNRTNVAAYCRWCTPI